MKIMFNYKSRILKGAFMAFILSFFFYILPAAAELPVSSKYYCLIDCQTGQTVLSKNAADLREVASTTKIMTAILICEYSDLNMQTLVSDKADKTAEYTIGLKVGQTLTLNELMKACLVKSANDAAVVLAESLTGDEDFFAYLMSKKAFLIGAKNTIYKNASGLPDKQHFSTAYDLAQIGRYALQIDEIKKLVNSREVLFRHPGYREPLKLRNTNTLLSFYSGADGIKTGTTNAAGRCLVGSATRGEKSFIAVVLNAADRAGDCARLLDYGFKKANNVKLVEAGLPFKEIRINHKEKSFLPIYADHEFYVKIGDEKLNLEKRVEIDYQNIIPINKGDRIGRISIYIDNNYFTSISLMSGDTVNKDNNVIFKLFKERLIPLQKLLTN